MNNKHNYKLQYIIQFHCNEIIQIKCASSFWPTLLTVHRKNKTAEVVVQPINSWQMAAAAVC